MACNSGETVTEHFIGKAIAQVSDWAVTFSSKHKHECGETSVTHSDEKNDSLCMLQTVECKVGFIRLLEAEEVCLVIQQSF